MLECCALFTMELCLILMPTCCQRQLLAKGISLLQWDDVCGRKRLVKSRSRLIRFVFASSPTQAVPNSNAICKPCVCVPYGNTHLPPISRRATKNTTVFTLVVAACCTHLPGLRKLVPARTLQRRAAQIPLRKHSSNKKEKTLSWHSCLWKARCVGHSPKQFRTLVGAPKF